MTNVIDRARATVAKLLESVRAGNRCELAVAAAAALAALVFLVGRARLFFPNTNGLVGHDYSWFLPTLLVGHFWHRQNGWLTPPDFTPAFCGGVPFLANPQSVFYSLPQLLMWVLEPIPAVFATLVVSATVGAAGCYVLLRRHFRTSVAAATLGATLFLLNGFLFYRVVIGHLTYHSFGVVPLLACAVASAQQTASAGRLRTFFRSCLLAVWGGLFIAYLTYGGALNFQIPAVLTVACTLVILQMRRGFHARPWLVLTGSCLWGMLVSAMKLIPAVAFAAQFPRSYLPDYLFADPVQMLTLMGIGLFAPAALPDAVQFPGGAGLKRHEFELGLSIIPLWLIVLAVRRRGLTGVTGGGRMQWAALAGLLLIPIVLTLGPREWGVFLLQVPVLNNNTTFVRWWALYLLPVVVAAARSFDIIAPTVSRRCAMLLLCVAVVVGQERYDTAFYLEKTADYAYDPGPITTAYRQVQHGIALPTITQIARDTSSVPHRRSNEAFIKGASAWPCYEPLFGYKLELLPPNALSGLVRGPVTLQSADGRLNLIDPSNYFVARDRATESWKFDKTRESDARLFAEHRPYVWTRPWWHQASRIVTVLALTLSSAFLLVQGAQFLISAATRRPKSQ